MKKLEEDVQDCADFISQEANAGFNRRVLGFERLRTLLGLYELPVRLYGSCACGIVVKNSDVDIAVD
jgi:predicted nucleotidyltransferase